MANVIDALIVTLGLDSSNFQQGSREATRTMDKFSENAQRDAKAVMLATQEMSRGFRTVRNELVGMLGLSLGGVGAGKLISNTIGDQAQLSRMSVDLKTSSRDLDAWGRMVTAVGGQAEDAFQSMYTISDRLQAFRLGEDTSIVGILNAAGVATLDENNQTRSADDILKDVLNNLSKMDSPSLQRYVTEKLGISDSLLQARRQAGSNAEFEQLYNRFYQASNVTEGSVQASQEAQIAFAELNAELRGVWQTIFNEATPAMKDLTEVLDTFGNWLNENRGDVEGFFNGIVDGVENIDDVLDTFTGDTDEATKQLAILTAGIVALAGAAAVIGRGGGLLRMLFPFLLAELGIRAAGAGDEWLDGTAAGPANRAGGQFLTDLNEWVANLGEEVGGPVREYLQENLPGYDLISNQPEEGRATALPEDQQSLARYVTEYFMAQGWTREQAAGIAANLQAESAFDPNAVGDNGQAYGVAQWHPDRQARFEDQFGFDIRQSTLEDQLDFVQHELTAGNERRAGDMLRQAKTAASAASVVTTEYERPADKEIRARERAAIARGIYADTAGSEGLYGGSSPAINVGGDDLPVQATPNQQGDDEPPIGSKRWVSRMFGLDQAAEETSSDPMPISSREEAQDQDDAPMWSKQWFAELLGVSESLKDIATPSLPVGASANTGVTSSNITTNTSSSETHIGTIEVHTPATDGYGVASDLSETLRQNELINASTTGMN